MFAVLPSKVSEGHCGASVSKRYVCVYYLAGTRFVARKTGHLTGQLSAPNTASTQITDYGSNFGQQFIEYQQPQYN